MGLTRDKRTYDELAAALRKEQQGARELVALLEGCDWKVTYAPGAAVISAESPYGTKVDRPVVIRSDALRQEINRLGWDQREGDDDVIRELGLAIATARELLWILESIGWRIRDYNAQGELFIVVRPDGSQIGHAFGELATGVIRSIEMTQLSSDDYVRSRVEAAGRDPASPPTDTVTVDLPRYVWREVEIIARERSLSKHDVLTQIIANDRTRERDLVLEIIRCRHGVTATELASAAHLSSARIGRIVEDLQFDGLITANDPEMDERSDLVGERHYGIRADLAYAVGVSFGRRHIRVGLADFAFGLGGPLFLQPSPTAIDFPVDTDGVGALEMADALVKALLSGIDRERVLGAVVAIPAPIDRTLGRVIPQFLPGWEGLRPVEEMHSRLGLPVVVENDANLGALGEATVGAARGCRHVAFVKLSTGIGLGFILDGQMWTGSRGVAGELGHTMTDSADTPCYCGHNGCLEAVAGGGALVAQLGRKYGQDSVAGIVKVALDGADECRSAIELAARRIGVALAGVCGLINPECLVVGGSLTDAGSIVMVPIEEELRGHLVQTSKPMRLLLGALGNEAAMCGAVEMVLRSSRGEFRPALRRVLKQE